MASSTEQFENDQEIQRDDNVRSFEGTGNDRRDIAQIIADPLFKKLVSSDALRGYQELASGNEAKPITPDQLKKMREYLVQEWNEAQAVFGRINQDLEGAVSSKIASNKDRDFLLNTLFFKEGEHFGREKFDVAEKLIGEKVDRMKRDREAYDGLVHSPLVSDGVLTVGENTQFKIPNEDAYLKMSVPERRAFLSKANGALIKAKEYSEKTGSTESAEHLKDHKSQLDQALKKKIIGKKTYDRLMRGLKPGEKHNEGELEKELEQNEALWAKIRKTLKGETLTELEKKLDTADYGELLALFGSAKEKESKKLLKIYQQGSSNQKGLDDYLAEGVISQHTYDQFVDDFGGKALDVQYMWMDSLPMQMARYKTLQGREKALSKKHREVLDANFDSWGFTERSAFLKNPDDVKYKDNLQQKTKSARMLGTVQDNAKREAIVKTDADLDRRGTEQKRRFLTRLKNMFEHKTSDSVDAQDFQKKLRASRTKNQNRYVEAVPEPANASHDLMDMQANLRKKRANEDAVHEELDAAEEQGARVVHDEGFDQVEKRDVSGHKSRITRVEINREKGMDRFFSEDHKGTFKSEEQGGHDDLRLAIKKSDGNKVELDLEEIRAMKKFMEAKGKLDKAA